MFLEHPFYCYSFSLHDLFKLRQYLVYTPDVFTLKWQANLRRTWQKYIEKTHVTHINTWDDTDMLIKVCVEICHKAFFVFFLLKNAAIFWNIVTWTVSKQTVWNKLQNVICLHSDSVTSVKQQLFFTFVQFVGFCNKKVQKPFGEVL